MKIVVDRDKCEGLGMCESMAHELPLQLAALRPERGANADFAPSLRDHVGDHAVDADDTKQQRHRRGNRQHHERE